MATQPDKPAPKATLTIGGKTVPLENLPVADGLAAYNALSSEDQKQADMMALIISNCAKVLEIAESKGLEPTQLVKDWVQSAGNTTQAQELKTKFTQAQNEAITLLNNSGIDMKTVARSIPGGETLSSFINFSSGVGTVAGAGLGVAGAVIDGAWNGPKNLWNLGSTLGRETLGMILGNGRAAPSDNAKAFAAAMVTLYNQTRAERHQLPLVANPFGEERSQFGSNPTAYTKAGLAWGTEWLTQNTPFAEYVIAAVRYLVGKLNGDSKPFDQLVNTARTEIQEAAKTRPADRARYIQLADNATRAADGIIVTQHMVAAKKVAKIPTAQAAPAANGVATGAGQTTIEDHHGVQRTFSGGKETKTVTPGDRVAEAFNTLVGDGNIVEQTVRAGAAGATVGTVAVNGAAGLARGVLVHTPVPLGGTMEKVARWAHEPVGLGPIPAPGKWSWINLPGKLASGLGEATGRTAVWLKDGVVGTYNIAKSIPGLAVDAAKGTAAAAANATTGTVQGVASAIGQPVSQASGWIGRTFAGLGKGAALTAGATSVAIPVYKTFEDIGAGDTTGAVIHGSQTAAIGSVIVRQVAKEGAKLGLKRSIPVVGAVFSGGEFINAAAHGDKGGMIQSGTELGGMGAGAAAGAALGVWFGGVGAVPGAAIGATVGGIGGWITGMIGRSRYESSQAKPLIAEQPKPTELKREELVELDKSNPGLAQAVADACKAGRPITLGANPQSIRSVNCGALGMLPSDDKTPRNSLPSLMQEPHLFGFGP